MKELINFIDSIILLMSFMNLIKDSIEQKLSLET